MTDHRHQRTAREEAITLIESIDDFWRTCPIPASHLIDALAAHGDLLQRLHDEALMTRGQWS
jgi:hypothetical protein